MKDEPLFDLSAQELNQLLLKKKISAHDLNLAFLDHLEKQDQQIHSFLYHNRNDVLKYAKIADENLGGTEPPGTLHGIPIAVTDSIRMSKTPATYGSRLLEKNISQEDAYEVQELKKKGALILGKTNMPEFGLSYDTQNDFLPACQNPWSPEASPGTGGGAAAVAAKLVPLALENDLDGSLRMSASFCGLPGLVPSRGRIPLVRDHLLLFSDRYYYRKGAIARDIGSLGLLLQSMAGPDPKDKKCCQKEPPNYLEEMEKASTPLTIGYSFDMGFMPLDPEVRECMEKTIGNLKKMGHRLQEISLPFHSDLLAHFFSIFASDRTLMIERLLKEQPNEENELQAYTREWLEAGRRISGRDYSMALTYSSWVKDEMKKVWKQCDLLLTPTMPAPPHAIGKPPKEIAGTTLRPLVGLLGFLLPYSMSGDPALTLPCGLSKSELPIGMQFGAPFLKEERLLRLGREYEKAHPWKFPEA